MPHVRRLIDGNWKLVEESWGWMSPRSALKIIPVYVWPDGDQILSLDMGSNGVADLAFVRRTRQSEPKEMKFDPSTRTFVGVSTVRILNHAPYLLTFLHECGFTFNETQDGLTKTSCVPLFVNHQIDVNWTWKGGGRFTDDEQVRLDILLGNVPLPLLPFNKLENRIRESRG